MRKSVRVSAPAFVMTAYYGAFLGGYFLLLHWAPGVRRYLPVGGIHEVLSGDPNQLELITSPSMPYDASLYVVQLALACVAATLLMAPISWMYFITTPTKRVDRSFAQTMIILPIVVAGIVMMVQNSIALAFSLAGIVAAVRFRFTLDEPAHTVYIFCAVAVGLGAGIASVGIALVISMGFVYGTLVLWALDYGARLNSPFFAFLTSRDHKDDEL